MEIELTRFDTAAYLADEASQAEYLSEAFATGEASFIAHAIGVVARARGMSQLAVDSGINRQQLYRVLDKDGNPTLETLTKILGAMKLKLQAVPA